VRAARRQLGRVRRWVGFPIRALLFRGYLSRHAVAKLQLGAGTNRLPGWLNTDGYPVSLRIAVLDARGRFPFADRSFDYVWSEHHIEHIALEEGARMLRECRRILKPGGRIRIATPDLDVLLALRREPLNDEQRRYIDWIQASWLPEAPIRGGTVVVNHAFRAWGHQFLYDEATLRAALRDAGFGAIERLAPGISPDPHLRGLECHGEAVGNPEMVRFETMVLEGVRPG
jgi:predicted SAM-dependent methyltransferase